MNKTQIEWVKNPDGSQGFTWNPITGCLNHTPEGLCLGGMFPCYAYKLAHGRLRNRYLANLKVPYEAFALQTPDGKMFNREDPFYPRLWEERMWLPHLVGSKKKPKGIFVCDMSDLFGIGVPEDWTSRVLDVISKFPRHRFYLLTKQPQNLIKFSPFPDNCWVGVTATDYDMARRALYELNKITASIKYISFEPLLAPIYTAMLSRGELDLATVHWVIIGAQTKPYKPPKIEWVEEILVACHNANIPVFMKNNLRPLIDSSVGWGEVWKLRQEMPG